MMEGPCADSEEKHEPASDIDTVVVDSLKALDPKRPIREADVRSSIVVRNWGALIAIAGAMLARMTRRVAH